MSGTAEPSVSRFLSLETPVCKPAAAAGMGMVARGTGKRVPEG